MQGRPAWPCQRIRRTPPRQRTQPDRRARRHCRLEDL